MAHDIAMIEGKPAMAYFGKKPWHGLGVEWKSQKTTAAEVIKAATLDWEVEKKPVFAVEGYNSCVIPRYCAMVRATSWKKLDCEPFGLVGENYQVLQNRDSFGFFDHHLTYANPDQRMKSLYFGEGEDTKHRAFGVALTLSRN
jgi:hypothetical protein